MMRMPSENTLGTTGLRCKEETEQYYLLYIYLWVLTFKCFVSFKFVYLSFSPFRSLVWRSQRIREGAWLQRGAFRFHPVPHQAILLTMYPLTCINVCVAIMMILDLSKQKKTIHEGFYMAHDISFIHDDKYIFHCSLESSVAVLTPTATALTKLNRWSWFDLHLGQRGEEPGSALQIYST